MNLLSKTSLIASVSALAIIAAGVANAQTPPGVNTSPFILENLNGVAVSTSSAPKGIPTSTSYASEGSAYTDAIGSGVNAGNVLVDSTGALVPCGTACGNTADVGQSWVPATGIDPTQTYKWVSATYANEAASLTTPIAPVTTAPAAAVVATNAWASGDYAVDANGKLVSSLTGCVTATPCTWVSPSAIDVKQLGVSTDLAANTGKTGSTSPTGDSTTRYLGGAVYSNNGTGQSTAIGTGGIVYSDGKGGSVTIGDPSITVTNGLGSTTVIHNGDISATGTVTAGTLSDGAGTTISGGTVTAVTVSASSIVATGSLSASSGATVDMGGNRVRNVGTPTAATDATTKAYVDSANQVQDQRLNGFTPTGYSAAGTVENWAGGVNNTLSNYGTAIADNTKGIASLNALYRSQQGQINTLSTKAFSGIAMAFAMQPVQVDPGKHFGIQANWGTYENQNAGAVNAKWRIDNTWSAVGGVAFSQGGQVGGTLGLGAQF